MALLCEFSLFFTFRKNSFFLLHFCNISMGRRGDSGGNSGFAKILTNIAAMAINMGIMAKFSHISRKLRQFVLLLVVIISSAFVIGAVFSIIKNGTPLSVATIAVVVIIFWSLMIQMFCASWLGLKEFYDDNYKAVIGMVKSLIDMIRKIIYPGQ